MEDAAAHPLLELPPATQENGRFTVAIIAALTLHAAALALGLVTPPRHVLGDESGSPDGVTVEIADPSELSGRPAQPAAPPAQPPPAMTQAQTPPEPAPAQPAPAEAAPDLKPSTQEDAPAPVAEAPAKEAAAEPPPAAPAAALDDPNLFKIQPKTEATPSPQPAAQPKSAKQQKPAKPEKPAQLSMTVPTPSFTSSNDLSGRSAGVSRPPGITRSGLNDEFGRGVVRALRQTMPPNGRSAQATVRFVLSADGNLLEVALVQSSGDAALDRSVVFAVKQANFPIPATNLTALDRQFRVTYVYR